MAHSKPPTIAAYPKSTAEKNFLITLYHTSGVGKWKLLGGGGGGGMKGIMYRPRDTSKMIE